ncbi:hypothetical protein [Geminicoccus sp.]|uniref:hypothetical protein n=1 Tax=Geminicoccus sp. TaxID=2024832 RepID=UPI0039C8A9DD
MPILFWLDGRASVVELGEVAATSGLPRLGLSAITRQYGLDGKTVRRYIAHGLEPPGDGPRQLGPTLLDPSMGYPC